MISTEPQATPASTDNFTSPNDPTSTSAGETSTAGWNSIPTPSNNFNTPSLVLESVGAPIRTQLPLTNGITFAANSQTNQYKVVMSLSGANGLPQTIVLSPTAADGRNSATFAVAPQLFTYQFRSRNQLIASLSTTPTQYAASSTLTAVGRGQCDIVITSPRACNASFTNSTPSGTEGVSASLLVTVLA